MSFVENDGKESNLIFRNKIHDNINKFVIIYLGAPL